MYDDIVPITPSDTVDFTGTALAPDKQVGFRVDVGGNVTFRAATGIDRVRTMVAGECMPVRVTKIYATGTTATGISLLIGRHTNW